MSPQATSEIAGTEWYDSGIGFAVPLASIEAALERMKRGDDQFPGILGVSFAMGLAQSSPAEIAAVRPNSPAGSAGFRKGDRIIAVNDRPVASQTDLRFALGPRYAGETVQVKLKRGDDELERSVMLVGKLEPFRHPFLGVLPMRPKSTAERTSDQKAQRESARNQEDSDHKQEGADGDDSEDQPATTNLADGNATASDGQQGVVIRMVYHGSPAADADVQAGDRLVRIDETNCRSIGKAIATMNAYAPGSKISIRVLRGDQPLGKTVTLSEMPTSVPGELPPAIAASSGGVASPAKLEAAEKATKIELRELKLAEFTETCQVYVPDSNESDRPAGVILWLHAPGEAPTDELFHQWQSICDRDGVILVAPKAADPSRWERTEIEYLRRLIERVVAQYRVDPRRVVVYGNAGGGAMAAALGLASRDIFSGIAITDATLPRTLQVPENDPSARLAIYAGLPADESQAALIRNGLKKLSEAGYPVTAVTLSNSTDGLSGEEREQLARWIDTLDRF
jgi:serine protease Do